MFDIISAKEAKDKTMRVREIQPTWSDADREKIQKQMGELIKVAINSSVAEGRDRALVKIPDGFDVPRTVSYWAMNLIDLGYDVKMPHLISSTFNTHIMISWA
jgi:hypothetical protein